MKKKHEIMWAITGEFSLPIKHRELYIGTFLSRIDAIDGHTKDMGESWKKCYRNGDRCVRVKMIILDD